MTSATACGMSITFVFVCVLFCSIPTLATPPLPHPTHLVSSARRRQRRRDVVLGDVGAASAAPHRTRDAQPAPIPRAAVVGVVRRRQRRDADADAVAAAAAGAPPAPLRHDGHDVHRRLPSPVNATCCVSFRSWRPVEPPNPPYTPLPQTQP